jgi:hypothetical protein
MILAKYQKQSGETMDYDVSYAYFFSTRSDTPSSITVTVDTGITLTSSSLNTTTKVVKVVLSGGTNGATYKVTIKLTTSSGIIKEDELVITIKDY